MTEQRLSAIANIAIETDMAKLIDFDKVVIIFARMPNVRDCSASLSTRTYGACVQVRVAV